MALIGHPFSSTSTTRSLTTCPSCLSLLLIVTLFLSTSVLSVPLERTQLTDSGNDIISSESRTKREGGGLQEGDEVIESGYNERSYKLEPKGQLFFPSLLSEPHFNHQILKGGSPAEMKLEESSPSEWETVRDPHLYLYTERDPGFVQQRSRRRGPSLSIVNPLEVLRERLLLEIARRKMRQSHSQIMANAEILRNIGKRRRR